MRSTTNRCLGLLLPLALLWPAAGVAAEAKSGVSGPEMSRIMQDEGYQAKLTTDGDGDPQIESRMDGMTTYVQFYDCEQGRCGSLQFSVGLDLENGTTAKVVNAFNKQFRYGRVYLDDEQDPFLKFDFEVVHADQARHVASQIETWELLLSEFARATGFRGSADTEGTAHATGASAAAVRPAVGALAR